MTEEITVKPKIIPLLDVTVLRKNDGIKRAVQKTDDSEYADVIYLERSNFYSALKLNSCQRAVFDYVYRNSQAIIGIQAGPGCGKSFLLKTMGYDRKMQHKTKFMVVIFKKDLLDTFDYFHGEKWTVAKFMMILLNLKFFAYTALDMQLSVHNISPYQYLLILISLYARAKYEERHQIMFKFDEYTVISKELLYVVLMVCKYNKIGAIFCGDRNQLQTIHSSAHTSHFSSFDMVAAFADKTFTLAKNERCQDEMYNEIVAFLSQFSSNKKLDSFAFAVVGALFPTRLHENSKYEHTHLAGTHAELTHLAHALVCRDNIPVEFYCIDMSRTRDKLSPNVDSGNNVGIVSDVDEESCNNNEKRKYQLQPTYEWVCYSEKMQGDRIPDVNKYLPYLPLKVGATYYYQMISDKTVVKLISYDAEKHECVVEQTIGEITNLITVRRSSSYHAITEQHEQYLLDWPVTADEQGEQRALLHKSRGALYNYPLYPTNFLSMHKCQGCTITSDIDVMLKSTNFQGLYVALSRVTRPSQIARITMPNQISILTSVIVNFPCLIDMPYDSMHVPLDVLQTQIDTDAFKLYDVSELWQFYGDLTAQYISPDANSNLREQIYNIFRLTLNHQLTSSTSLDLPYCANFINDFKRGSGIASSSSDDCLVLIHKKPEIIKYPRTSAGDINNRVMVHAIQYCDIIAALARLDEIDRFVWLHEWMLTNTEMRKSYANICRTFENHSSIPDDVSLAQYKTLLELTHVDKAYQLYHSSMVFIDNHSVATAYDKNQAQSSMAANATQQNIIYMLNDYCCKVAPSAFCRAVYLCYANDSRAMRSSSEHVAQEQYPNVDVITEEWLFEQLNAMLELTISLKKQSEMYNYAPKSKNGRNKRPIVRTLPQINSKRKL